MKTAICMIGHFRTFESIYKKLLNLDATFFMHTWSDYRVRSQNENRPFLEKQKDILLKFDKHIVIEDQSTLNLKQIENVPVSYNAIIHATKNVLKRVVESDLKFDRIILSRFDIDLKNYNVFPNKNDIFHTFKFLSSNHFNDVLVMLNGDNLNDYYNSFQVDILTGRMEDILDERCKQCNLNIIKKFKLSKDVNVLRFSRILPFVYTHDQFLIEQTILFNWWIFLLLILFLLYKIKN